jgi:hypothetical protein
VRTAEFVIGVVFAAVGVRSLVHWARRPFASTDVKDHLLYAAYLTGRVGFWFALAGAFFLFAFVGTTDPGSGQRIASQGRAYVDDLSRYRWYVLVFAVLGAMQLLAGWFLGHRGELPPADAEAQGEEPDASG